MTEVFSKNSKLPNALHYFCKKASSKMFDEVLNTYMSFALFLHLTILENITKAPLKTFMLKSLFSGVLGSCMLYEKLTLQEQSFADVLQNRCS